MGRYDAILDKHGVAQAEDGGAGRSTPAAGAAEGVSDAMGHLAIGGATGGGGGEAGRATARACGTGTAATLTYAGELNHLRPATLVREEEVAGPPPTRTKYRGYNVDPDAMRERLRRNNASRRGADGT